MIKRKDQSPITPPLDVASLLIAIPFIALMLYLLLRKNGGGPTQPLPRVPIERWKNWWPLDD